MTDSIITKPKTLRDIGLKSSINNLRIEKTAQLQQAIQKVNKHGIKPWVNNFLAITVSYLF